MLYNFYQSTHYIYLLYIYMLSRCLHQVYFQQYLFPLILNHSQYFPPLQTSVKIQRNYIPSPSFHSLWQINVSVMPEPQIQKYYINKNKPRISGVFKSGAEENRTPVRKPIGKDFSHHRLSFEIPLSRRRQSGCGIR